MATALKDLSLEYSLIELQQATNHFHEQNRLGVGSFGGVFRGIQRDGTEIAIKVLNEPEEAGFEEEVRVLSKFRHPNLVILMGFAKNGPGRLLVYEHLGGGDVFNRLQKCTCDNVPFTWKQRISVAYDASCGLSHLHNSTPKVFHRDIKCPNILLDRNGTAKMADFGLACCSHAKETKAAGTVGYACPHYVNNSVVTERSEVYSFGIVLLELLTASPPATKREAADGSIQWDFLVTALGYDLRVALQQVDRKAGFPHEVAANFAHLGLKCTEYQEESRPFFAEVVTRLRDLRDMSDVLEAPSAPSLPPEDAPTPPAAMRLPPPPPRYHQPNQGYQQVPQKTVPQAQAQQAQQAQAQAQAQALQALQAQQHYMQVQQMQQMQMQTPHGQAQAQAQAQHMHLQRIAAQQAQAQQAQAALRLAQAQEDEYKLQILTGLGPVRQVSLPMHELERGNLTPIQGGSMLTQHGQVRRPRTIAYLAWTLECVMSKGDKLDKLAKDQKNLMHRREEGKPVPTMRFGRLFDEEFLNLVLPDDKFYYHQVSREHFQIWAEEWPSSLFDCASPHSIRLTNYATVGTSVDDLVLDERGQQAILHDGSKIGLLGCVIVDGKQERVPFLEFRFNLGSSITDVDVGYESILGRMPAEMPFEGRALPHDRHEDNEFEPEGLGIAVPGGISFAGDDVEPVFILEVGGTAVRAGSTRAQLRVLHGPRKSACAAAPGCEVPCPPLVLGSAQAGFWRRILDDKAILSLLEPEHLMIEEAQAEAERCFYVSKLPLRVEGPPEDNTRGEDDGKWALHHGDTILLSLSKGTSMWMNFRAFR
eukprot:symbB.v1.2.001594.t1/scaffold88.1/size340390/29